MAQSSACPVAALLFIYGIPASFFAAGTPTPLQMCLVVSLSSALKDLAPCPGNRCQRHQRAADQQHPMRVAAQCLA
jgi:hypothetical protein